ncbi:ATP-grasp domain-containing protein [Pedobacter metabolipauper]|uniref:Uncharacterized protein n=1 Tax=Pedobacter metabolipauper TaxID=425513 RepID=A0A4R6STC0_9SPHI|nr:hypothetical protein [Pedobacter metabolipauper]TDQ08163.1 hypothetical protein ATK78_2667 [Pedobacter metabolipauper]
MRVLITGGKSAQSLKLLKAFKDDEIVLADYGDMPSFPSAQYQFISLGEKKEDIIAHNLLSHCLDEGIDAILPLHFFEVEAIAKSSVLFEEFNILVLLPGMEELSQYLSSETVPAQAWAIFIAGNLRFASNPLENLEKIGKDKQLNGLFHIFETINNFRASLITI